MLFNEQDAAIKSEMTVFVCDENILYDVELSLPIVFNCCFCFGRKSNSKDFQFVYLSYPIIWPCAFKKCFIWGAFTRNRTLTLGNPADAAADCATRDCRYFCMFQEPRPSNLVFPLLIRAFVEAQNSRIISHARRTSFIDEAKTTRSSTYARTSWCDRHDAFSVVFNSVNTPRQAN